MDEMRDTSNSEFTDERIRTNRTKICTYKKVIIFSFFSLISAAGVVALVYFCKPNFSKIKNVTYGTHLTKEEYFERVLQNTWLPKNVIPKYYRLRVQPNYTNSNTFTGQVTIALDCRQNTDIIILHSENLNITKIECTTVRRELSKTNNTDAELTKRGNITLANPEIKSKIIPVLETVQKHSKLLINLEEYLIKGGSYFLNVQFSGNLRDNEFGIVQNEYVDQTGQRKSILATNFQPGFARRAFPCFDEFGFDARFEVSIAKRTSMVALSNTCMRETEAINTSPGLVWNHFEATPVMPAHQVSFAIGEMKSVNASTKKAGPVVKIWGRKPLLAQTKYASSIAGDILDFMREYFGVNFPLQKLDLVLVPRTSNRMAGHLGLIFFSEHSIISNNKTMDLSTKNRIFSSIAESIIRQWLDYFLPSNWSTFWINQGLSTYLTYFAQTALLNPSALDNFPLEVLQPTFQEDGAIGITLSNAIKREGYVIGTSNTFIGSKASCVLRMISENFGEKSFRRELGNYFKHKNTSGEISIWENMHITDSLGKNTSADAVLISWMHLSGYPLVTVTRNYKTSMIKIQQIKFSDLKSGSDHWIIPLSYKVQDNNITSTIILDQNGIKINSTVSSDAWIIFNVNQNGYYRVNYDMNNWNMLIKQLKDNHTLIELPNRVQLVNDAFELSNSGYMKHTIPFKLITYLENDRNYAPWKATVDALEWIEGIISETKHFGIYKEYMLQLLKAEEKVYNFTQTTALHSLQINKICSLRYKPCVTKATKLFENLYLNYTQQLIVPQYFQKTIYCLGIESGPEEYWDFVWELSKNASSRDKEVFYSALGCSRDMWKLTSYLEKAISGSIEPEYAETVWKSLSRKPIGRLVGLNFLENRWDDIYSSYKTKPNLIKAIIEQFLSNLATEIDLKKVAVFYDKHRTNLKSMSETVKNALTKIKMRVSWKEKFLDSVLPLLSPNGIISNTRL